MFKIIVMSLCVLSLPSYAYQFLTEDQAVVQQKKIAKGNLTKAQKAYFSKYNACIEQSQNNTLNPSDFNGIKLNEKELRATVLYYSAKTQHECVGDLTDKYITAISVAKSFGVSGYSAKDAPLAIDEVKYLPDYLQIDKTKRDAIEKLPRINKVFQISESFKALNTASQ